MNTRNPERRTGLLFSGGVDATYSLINNLEYNPNLIMIWGIDNFQYPEHSDHWSKTKDIYSKFAESKNLGINYLHTNASQIFDDKRISHKYHKELLYGTLRAALQHSLILLPLLAPLSIRRFDRVIIAASVSPDYNLDLWPYAATPEADEMIVWADLMVKHDGYVKRHEKIKAIAAYLQKEKLTLRVCKRSKLIDGCLNDNECEKCLRTIVSLVFAGVNPNDCGFNIDESTFELIKKKWRKKDVNLTESWWELQEIVPKIIDYDIYGSKKFFEWFRDYKMDQAQADWFYTDLYNSLPFSIAKYLDMVYLKLNIQRVQGPWKRERAPLYRRLGLGVNHNLFNRSVNNEVMESQSGYRAFSRYAIERMLGARGDGF